MNTKRFFFITLTLILFCIPAYANQGLTAMGDAFELIFRVFIGMLILAVANIIIGLVNLSRKSHRLRWVSVILTIPMLLVAMLSFLVFPPAGFVGFIIVIFQGTLIFRSLEKG